jgi:hypothetical protein
MDINNIFGLFDNGEKQSPNSEVKTNTETEVKKINYEKHPLFWIGMFRKLIINHNTFKHGVIDFFGSLDGELDVKDIKRAGEHLLYNRSWDWIVNINLNDLIHRESLEYYTQDDNLLKCIKLSILYFQDVEEYEKCAHLKNIQDFLESI